MTDGILHPIESIEAQPGYRLLVTWATGGQSTIDFSGDIRRGGIWEALRDEARFAQVRLAFRGRVVEWPEPVRPDGTPRIDVDADGLHAMAARQRAAERSALLVSAGQDGDHAA
jgi:hypothetical protein